MFEVKLDNLGNVRIRSGHIILRFLPGVFLTSHSICCWIVLWHIGQLYLNPVQAVVQFRPSMKYIDDHDAAKKKSNKDAGITDGDDEEMFDAEPVENKSELTLLQVGFLCFTVESY